MSGHSMTGKTTGKIGFQARKKQVVRVRGMRLFTVTEDATSPAVLTAP